MLQTNQYVSDELFHFVGRHEPTQEKQFGLIVKILESGILLNSRANKPMTVNLEERLMAGELTRVPAICFCDIPRHLLRLHTEKYSQFGLSFTKLFLSSKSAKPVIYVPHNSRPSIGPGMRGIEIPRRLRKSLNALMELDKIRVDEGKSRYSDKTIRDLVYSVSEQWGFLTTEIYYYVKVFDENLPQDHQKNYYMEREWRVVSRPTRTYMQFSLTDVNAVMVPWMFRAQLLNEFPALGNRVIHP